MKYEDITKPAFLLNKGVDKLLKYGPDTFDLYADEVGLSYCDRNRVIAKAKFISPNKGFKEMACPDELVGERWNFYKYRMRYPEDKIRELIKTIDDFYKNQFIPSAKPFNNFTL